MGKRYRIILFLFFTANMVFAESNLDSLLVNLDQTILQHEIYKDRREARIRELKGKATKTAPNSIAAYQLNDSIYREYKSYMCDSAVLYLTKNIRIARNLRDQEREYKSKLLLASLHAATGMYQEAIDVLEEVRREDLPASLTRDYYACKEQVYREISGNSRDPQSIRRYEDKSFVYRDSLAMMLPEDAGKRVELQELALRADGRTDEALRINDTRLAKIPFGTPEYALTSYQRAMIYRQKKDREKEKYYLALSSLSDIQSAITDHASLWMLADLLLKDGDIERAYHYIRFSWDETNRFRARSRSWQSADILSLIDKNYQATIEEPDTGHISDADQCTYFVIDLCHRLYISADEATGGGPQSFAGDKRAVEGAERRIVSDERSFAVRQPRTVRIQPDQGGIYRAFHESVFFLYR